LFGRQYPQHRERLLATRHIPKIERHDRIGQQCRPQHRLILAPQACPKHRASRAAAAQKRCDEDVGIQN